MVQDQITKGTPADGHLPKKSQTVMTCEACGTFWGGIPDGPFVHDRCRMCGGSAILAARYVSLACRPGKLVVRAGLEAA